MPYFSVIIPLYNKADQVERALNSILNQTFSDFEIIIINDGSTDNSLEIVKKYTDSRISIYNQTNKGASIARNNGIDKSNSNYITFLDADDYWEPNHLEVLHKLILDFPDAGMYCSRYKVKLSENKIQTLKFKNIDENYRGYIDDFFYSSLEFRIASTIVVAIPKETFAEIGCFNSNISSGQDLDLWIRIAIKHKIAISNQVTALYHNEVANSLSKNNILSKSLIDFNSYELEAKNNPSLKKFLDIYKLEYALHFYMFGEKNKSNSLLKSIDKNSIPRKTKILFKLPPFALRNLLRLKHFFKKVGFDFSIYH